MKVRHFFGAVTCSLLMATAVVCAQNSKHDRAKEDGFKRVAVASVVSLRKGVEGFPAIEEDGRSAAEAINASLAEYDHKVLAAANECDGGLSASETKPDAGKERWTRTVEVTMRGPRYISYVAKDSYFCVGAHPDSETFALIYDLQTGKLVEWTKLIAGATSQTQSNSDGSEVQSVSSAALVKFYVGKVLPTLDKDCADAIRGEDFSSGFSIWPDAKIGILVLHPSLSYAVAACGKDVSLSVEEQRGVGLAEKMIVAIKAAHGGARE